MNITCIIIEDEPLARRKMEQFVKKVPFLQLLHSFESALDAIAFLRKGTVDLLLLDIRMDELTGIELLEVLPERPEVIICSAFEQYALKGFELQVTDYLLKPFSFERFLTAVLNVQNRLTAKIQKRSPEFVFIKTEHRLQKVGLEEILFVKGMGDYRHVHCLQRKIMTLETFGGLETKLPNHLFCRVHKSYLVALSKIESIERERIKIGKEIIPISETYRQQFFRQIG
jgi:two-component system LytT family response regulator